MEKSKLIILAGPTAVGKTKLSIELAKAVNGEIISADSMQVYKGMDIGSAKIMPEEMQGVTHYLIDVLDPKEEFNIVRFQQMAKQAMKEIESKGKIPILVGGTGFYIQSLLYDIAFKEEERANTALRDELQNFADAHGKEALHEKLRLVDPESAKAIPAGNVKRVIRALEFYETHGTKISEHNAEEAAKESPYNYAFFVLTDERAGLYERIELRIDKMLEDGLVNEVNTLKEQGLNRSYISMQGLGYKEIFAYLEGEISLEEAVSILKRDTRHFAKRQITWFKREKDVIWLDRSQYDQNEEKILAEMLKEVQNRKLV